MNVFTNSIINIIYSLLNSIMPENVKMLFVIVSTFTYIFGMILSYIHYKQKLKHPFLYVIPLIRIFAILIRDAENKKQEFYQKVCGTLLIFVCVILYLASISEEMVLGAFALGTISLALGEVFGAMLNYHLLCEADGVRMKDRNFISGILLYLFPFLYLYFTLPDDYKSKGFRRKVSAFLALLVFVEAFTMLPSLEVKAATPSINIGCTVCDSSSNLITYKMECCYCDGQTDELIYDSMIGITCNECEIIHVVDTNEDFGFKFEGDGNTCWTSVEDACAFIDFSRVSDCDESYSPYKLIVSNDGILVVEKSFKDKSWDYECKNFYETAIKEFYGDYEMNSSTVKLLPSGKEVYAELIDCSIKYDTNGAIICKPRNSDYSLNNRSTGQYVVDNTSNQDYTNFNGNNVNTNLDDEERISIGNVFKDIDWGKTVKDSLVKSLGAVGVGIGLAALASISTPIAVGIAAIGTVSAIVYGASTISRIMTIAKSDELSIEAKEYAWAGLASDLMSDGVALVAGSVAYSYTSNTIRCNKVRSCLLSESALAETNNHIANGIYRSADGVVGGHERSEFLKICNDNNCVVLQENATHMNGVSIIDYQIPRNDGSGLYKSKLRTKTVFDSSIISQEEFMNFGLEAVDNSIVKNHGKLIEGKNTGKDSNGVNWIFYVRDNKISTLYPES